MPPSAGKNPVLEKAIFNLKEESLETSTRKITSTLNLSNSQVFI